MKHDTQDCSVVLAIAELDRLERDRAAFASAKHGALRRLDQQASDINNLRGRLLAERPRASARVQRQQDNLRMTQARTRAKMTAQAQALHHERLARYQAELEAKRLRLATIESMPVVERPGRRLLEWSIPAAATALVAFLGFTFIGEEDAVARAADPADLIAVTEAQASEADNVDELAPEAAPEPEPEPEPEVEPEPEPEPEPVKVTKPKSTKSTPKSTKSTPKSTPKPKPKPTESKHSNPLKIGDFDGNPLG
ncbi:hypothetical protein DB30_00518 [Enhygromyxa salina]|uniref:Uncharacterized protein n=1 Tax=Enhygromyxa salina TaxID=215803 RepID=A0A0C2CU48_9BACT|nr:hypothetical protein [Enhygromyxa salina]KIG13140.1 hypothetical protein DB30_00518 [Enhygromyxa salina]